MGVAVTSLVNQTSSCRLDIWIRFPAGIQPITLNTVISECMKLYQRSLDAITAYAQA
jgi:hypothetical protein